MNKFAKLFFCIISVCFVTKQLIAQNIWILDEKLSEIKFELPVLLANNVEGQFNKFEGYVVIDIDNRENNRAFISVNINSIELNYKEYKNLLFSDIFFDEIHFPIAIIDTKKFSTSEKSHILKIMLNCKSKILLKLFL